MLFNARTFLGSGVALRTFAAAETGTAAAVVVVGGGLVFGYTQVVKLASSLVASQSSRVQSSVQPSSVAESSTPSYSTAVDVVKANVKDGTYLAFARDINKLTLENGVFDIEFTGVENNMSSYRSQLYNPVSEEQKIQIRCSGNKTIYGDMDYIYPNGGSGHLETLETLQQKIAVEKKQYAEYGEEAEDWHDKGYFFEIKDGCLTGIYYWRE